MSFRPASYQTIRSEHHLLTVQRPGAHLLTAGVFLTVLMCGLFPGDSLSRENTIFQQFTQHIGRQIHRDKQAFSQANSCLSWFYKAKKTPPPAVQGISWNATPSSQLEVDCLRNYPSGMDDARADFLFQISKAFWRALNAEVAVLAVEFIQAGGLAAKRCGASGAVGVGEATGFGGLTHNFRQARARSGNMR